MKTNRRLRHAPAAPLALALCLAIGGWALAQDRAVTTAVSIEQDQLASGVYTVGQVLESGRQFFAVPFIERDGHGEGDGGPRALQRSSFWTDPPGLEMPFLRMNGLDSQSCFECHNSAGTFVPAGEVHRTQKPGGLGGAAGIASILFGNVDFPQVLTNIIRTPPRAFGSAYVQEIALEMTAELQQIRSDAIADAQLQPGVQVTRQLTAKGIDFGTYEVTCPDSTCDNPTENVTGDFVSDDLIVRPFQNKGVTATVRSFVKTALDFHFSVQPVEVVGINLDCDEDGRINEMGVDVTTPASSTGSLQVQQSLGNVAALSAFTGMLRPPTQVSSTEVQEGLTIFRQIGCDNCHVETLTTRVHPVFRIELASPSEEDCTGTDNDGRGSALGSNAEASATLHPAERAVASDRELRQVTAFMTSCPQGFYCIDLSNPGTAPGEIFPRLTANGDGSVTVPLYSDLRRHDLGDFLDQVGNTQSDDAGNVIPNRLWLTQKLWGVSANGPWLHDGRARSLAEAITMHAGPTGADSASAAFTEVQSFLGLSDSDRLKLLAFLDSLVIPLPQ